MIDQIRDELLVARKNLKACNKSTDDVELLVLTILKIINSGQVRGIVNFRVNGHTITNPYINELKISLEDAYIKIKDNQSIIEF